MHPIKVWLWLRQDPTGGAYQRGESVGLLRLSQVSVSAAAASVISSPFMWNTYTRVVWPTVVPGCRVGRTDVANLREKSEFQLLA